MSDKELTKSANEQSDRHELDAEKSRDQLLQEVRRLRRENADLKKRELESQKNADAEFSYKLLADNITDIIWTADLNYRFTYISPSVEKVFGIPLEAAVHSNIADWMPQETFEKARALVEKAIELGKYDNPLGDGRRFLEFRSEFPGTDPIWVEVRVTLLLDENGLPTGFLGVTREIGERKAVEQKLRHQEETLRALLNGTNEAALLMDEDGNIIQINRVAASWLGGRVEDFTGKNGYAQLPKDVAERRYEANMQVLRTKRPRVLVDEHNGRHMVQKINPIIGPDGKWRIAVFAQDITEEILAKRQLRQAWSDLEARVEERTFDLRAANENLLREIERKKRAEKNLLRREKILDFLRFSSELFLKQPFNDESIELFARQIGLAADVSRVTIFKYLDDDSGEAEVIKVWNRSGEEAPIIKSKYFRFSARKVGFGFWEEEYKKGNLMAANVRDIEQPLREALESLSVVSLLCAPVNIAGRLWGLICLNDEEKERQWSVAEKDAIKAAAGIFGAASARDKFIRELDESRRTLNTLIENLPGMAYRCKNDQNWTMEFVSPGALALTGYKPDEIVLNRLLPYVDIIVPEDRELVDQAVQQGVIEKRSFQIHYRIRTRDGQIKHIWEQGCGIWSPDGELEALEGLILDITKRHSLETELKENAEEIDLYNDILAHDIGNINQITLNLLSNLLQDGSGNLRKNQKELIEACKGQVYRTSSLIEKVKTVRQMRITGEAALAGISLDEAIQIAIDNVERETKGREIAIRFKPEKGRKVVADHLIHQIFFNLIENAANHNRRKNVTIEIGVEDASTNGDRFWKIRVCDDGQGIRDELKQVVFHRFEKGRRRQGSGIGLAIVKALVQKYGGSVHAEDRVPGDHSKGACFCIYLPKA